MKTWFPPLFEGLVFQKIKPTIIEYMSKFQIGAKPGHQAQEHLFVLKSIMRLYKLLNIPIYATFWDISAFFDCQSLQDVLLAINQAGVQGKPLRLLYNLNKNTKIKVSTPLGLTKCAKTGENTGQGNLSSAVASSLHLDIGIQTYFHSSTYHLSYGKVKVSPMGYQDNALTLATSHRGAVDNSRFELLMKSRQLDVNIDKLALLPIASKKISDGIHEELEASPILYDNSQIKVKQSEK